MSLPRKRTNFFYDLLAKLPIRLSFNQWEATGLQSSLWLVRVTEGKYDKPSNISFTKEPLKKADGVSTLIYIYVNLHLTIWTLSQEVCACEYLWTSMCTYMCFQMYMYICFQVWMSTAVRALISVCGGECVHEQKTVFLTQSYN